MYSNFILLSIVIIGISIFKLWYGPVPIWLALLLGTWLGIGWLVLENMIGSLRRLEAALLQTPPQIILIMISLALWPLLFLIPKDKHETFGGLLRFDRGYYARQRSEDDSIFSSIDKHPSVLNEIKAISEEATELLNKLRALGEYRPEFNTHEAKPSDAERDVDDATFGLDLGEACGVPDSEVDALKEAEVYLGFGMPEKAAECLKKALSNPSNVRDLEWVPGGVDTVRDIFDRLCKLPECKTLSVNEY